MTARAAAALLVTLACAAPAAAQQEPAADPCREAEATARFGFDLYQGRVTPDAMPIVDRLAEVLRGCPDRAFELQIHTDTVRMSSFNARQSQAVAEHLRDLLVERGVDAARLAPCGYGESRPLRRDPSWTGSRNERLVLRLLSGQASAHRCPPAR